MQDESHELMARIFKTLADPTRLRLLQTLTLDCQSVSDLVQAAGLPQPLVSHHLRILREAGLARSARRGTFMFY
ncbi:MAG TPA: metalloregulator ArsR/SmtB family transcription factor [Chloroflexota bacterium]